MLAVLGYYVMTRTRAADQAAAAVAASARAVIEAENERKLREAERHWQSAQDAGPVPGQKPEPRRTAPSGKSPPASSRGGPR
jgi:hypothetical protein